MLVYFHGGGYFSGDKGFGGQSLLHHFARQGWVCISANYRLRPASGFAEHLADAQAALAWAREHSAEFGAGEDVFAAGSSSGAHLVSICAFSQPPGTRLAGVIGLYGYYGYYYGTRPGDLPVSSPFGYPVDGATPPFMIVHGDRDTYAPVEGARALAERLRIASSHAVVYSELPGAQHTFDLFRSVRFTAVIAGIDAFVSAIRGNGQGAPPDSERE